jgi:hypothetical protein
VILLARRRLRVLVGCEFSGRVRDAFLAAGHDAVSCDLLPSISPGPHVVGDVRALFKPGAFDLFIAHPPCTHLAVSGARHFAAKRASGVQASALDFFMDCLTAPFRLVACENPVSVVSTAIRRPDQVLQPWQFGHGEVKATCLWLDGLPPLVPTDVVPGREARVHRLPPSPDRWKLRSLTYPGVAAAMASQWGAFA